MRRYRNVSKRAVEDIEPGEEGELELSEEREVALVAQGKLEVLEAEYENVGPRTIFNHPPGEKFHAVLMIGQERHLIESGHLVRMRDKPKPRRKRSSDRGS